MRIAFLLPGRPSTPADTDEPLTLATISNIVMYVPVCFARSDARLDAIANASALLNKNGHVALIADGNQVVLVHWVGDVTDQRWGRTVGLELDGKLKYSTEVDSRKRPFRGHEVIHPNAGVRMWKDKTYRQQLPPDMKQLRTMFQRLFDGERAAPFAPCHVCELPIVDKSESIVCVLCSLGWHLRCSEKLFKWAKDTKWLEHAEPHTLSPAKWPQQLRAQDTMLCEFCFHAMQSHSSLHASTP